MLVERLGSLMDFAEDLLSGVAVMVLVAITLSVCLEVLLRYGFNSPLVWVVEITEYSLVYLCFLGTSWVLRNDDHVRVDLVMMAFSERWQHRFHVIGCLFGLAVSLVLLVFGARVTWSFYERGLYKGTVLEFPTWIVLIIIPIGSFLLCLRFCRLAVAHWRAAR